MDKVVLVFAPVASCASTARDAWIIKSGRGMQKFSHTSCAFWKRGLTILKLLLTGLNVNRTWQGTVPETSAKVYGVRCIHVGCNVLSLWCTLYPCRVQCISAMHGANLTWTESSAFIVFFCCWVWESHNEKSNTFESLYLITTWPKSMKGVGWVEQMNVWKI